jgi:hypothetical protein
VPAELRLCDRIAAMGANGGRGVDTILDYTR